jgi:hypothetical protein
MGNLLVGGWMGGSWVAFWWVALWGGWWWWWWVCVRGFFGRGGGGAETGRRGGGKGGLGARRFSGAGLGEGEMVVRRAAPILPPWRKNPRTLAGADLDTRLFGHQIQKNDLVSK